MIFPQKRKKLRNKNNANEVINLHPQYHHRKVTRNHGFLQLKYNGLDSARIRNVQRLIRDHITCQGTLPTN